MSYLVERMQLVDVAHSGCEMLTPHTWLCVQGRTVDANNSS